MLRALTAYRTVIVAPDGFNVWMLTSSDNAEGTEGNALYFINRGQVEVLKELQESLLPMMNRISKGEPTHIVEQFESLLQYHIATFVDNELHRIRAEKRAAAKAAKAERDPLERLSAADARTAAARRQQGEPKKGGFRGPAPGLDWGMGVQRSSASPLSPGSGAALVLCMAGSKVPCAWYGPATPPRALETLPALIWES